MDKVAWIQWSAQVHTGKLPLTLLNLELIVDHDLPNEIGERPQVFPFQKEEENLVSKSLFIAQAVPSNSKYLMKGFLLVFNYKMQYPASFFFVTFNMMLKACHWECFLSKFLIDF